MSSNYPEGSMMGSGIYAQDWTGVMDCPTCEKSVEVEGQTDDWGYTAYANCPECNTELEKDISPDEFGDEDSQPDPDDAYEDWRNSQLDN